MERNESRKEIKYTELAKAKISETRNAVISECSGGGYTIAQQLEIKEADGNITTVFMKGAFHIKSIDGLENLKAAIENILGE